MFKAPILRVALWLLVLALPGCATYRNATAVQDGPGLDIKAEQVTAFRANQDLALAQLAALAGLKGTEVAEGDWDKVIEAGMDYADLRCDEYIHALFRLNRDRKTSTAQLGLLGAASAGLMAAAEASARNVAAVAIVFGLASATVDNLSSNLLFELDPSSVRTLVRSLQASYRDARPTGYKSRPAALSVIRGYAGLCVPANIEAEVNVAVKSATPFASEGNGAAGKAPMVSNAKSAVSAFTVKFDDGTDLLKAFVFPGGALDPVAKARLDGFLKFKGITEDVSSFMRLERFAAERAEAVKSLGLKK